MISTQHLITLVCALHQSRYNPERIQIILSKPVVWSQLLLVRTNVSHVLEFLPVRCKKMRTYSRRDLPLDILLFLYLQSPDLQEDNVRQPAGRVYWASEASPSLGCSIEISRDIYICRYVCRYVGMSVICQINCVGGITWPTCMLKVVFGR